MTDYSKRRYTRGKDGGTVPLDIPLPPERTAFHDASADDEIIRALTPDETERLRLRLLDGPYRRAVERCLDADATLHSMTLLVGQYWRDNAIDAVSPWSVWSGLETPDLDAAAASEGWEPDEVNLGGRLHHDMAPPEVVWPENTYCISLFAAYCTEGGNQEGRYLEHESPIAVYRRTGPASASFEFVGEMIRPWLDGTAFHYASRIDDLACDAAAFEDWIDTADNRR